jgi:ubiquinone/menaquinone biosynthesis C-methylase UbiE
MQSKNKGGKMAEQGKHDHGHDHDDQHGDGKHSEQHDHSDGQHRADDHSDHGHSHDHDHAQGHEHDHEHGSSGGHSHDHKTRFHDPAHAAEFDRRSTMEGIRGSLTTKMIETLALSGNEWVLDVATGTGRVARPVSKHMKAGHIVGIDQALAMLDVGHQHKEPISSYSQTAGAADALPFKSNSFDRAFVSFSLHHFGNPSGVVKEVMRVLKGNGKFVVLDPIIEEAKDALDAALEAKINQVFRRTHGPEFRFHTASSIQRLLSKTGYRIPRTNILSYSFNQEGMDGIPTGRHWLEAALELENEAPDLAQRMKKNYLTWHAHDDHAHVKGSFSYALITGVKPA